jgi:hypothetical protein
MHRIRESKPPSLFPSCLSCPSMFESPLLT